jgi:dolichol kinase
MIPEENNMLLLYIRLFNEPNSINEVLFSLGWFYYLLFFFFYVLSIFMLINEFSRKSKKLSFPFTFFTKIYFNDKEHENYGTYLFFAIGQMFAAFISPPMIFFAILGISSISDLMASQIGIRFGKKHIKWNENKTWEGTLAGTITTFIICFLFIGVFWSLIFTVAFLVFDVVTNKPINISDNLLIPIGCSLIYIIVRFFFGLDYYTILLFWI